MMKLEMYFNCVAGCRGHKTLEVMLEQWDLKSDCVLSDLSKYKTGGDKNIYITQLMSQNVIPKHSFGWLNLLPNELI